MAHTRGMREMFVRSLFEELAFLKVSQREVAKYFGVSEGITSQWARGVKPLPLQRGEAFLAFVEKAEERALEQAKTQPRPATGATVLTGARQAPEEVLWEQIGYFKHKWMVELDDENGEIYEDLINQLHALRPYMAMDKDKLQETLNVVPQARQFRTAMITAAKGLLRELNRLERFKPIEEGR